MYEKHIRFKSSYKTAIRKNAIFPESKYFNKLYNLLKVYVMEKKLLKKIGEDKLKSINTFEIIKRDINDVFILKQCKLHNFPIKLSNNKFIETDYIEPYWDEMSNEKYPKFKMISKPYILVEILDDESLNIIELQRLEFYKRGKNVKIHNIKLPTDYEILYD